MNALNPVLNVRDQLLDVIAGAPATVAEDEQMDKAASLLDLVGIPRSRLRSYPHELSGGMRQRVMIAMALATDPEIVIMDEPTTALDVVVQRDILAQIVELKRAPRLRHPVHHPRPVAVARARRPDRRHVRRARWSRSARRAEIHHEPAHPYTKGLLNSFPSLHGAAAELAGIPGSPPDLRTRRPGCPFLPRCGYGTDSARAST